MCGRGRCGGRRGSCLALCSGVAVSVLVAMLDIAFQSGLYVVNYSVKLRCGSDLASTTFKTT